MDGQGRVKGEAAGLSAVPQAGHKAAPPQQLQRVYGKHALTIRQTVYDGRS